MYHEARAGIGGAARSSMNRRFNHFTLLTAIIAGFCAGLMACSGQRITDPAEKARQLYAEGKFGEAFREYQQILDGGGQEEGTLLYQAYDCLRELGAEPVRMAELQSMALERLEEVIQKEEAGLEEYYYLASLLYQTGKPVEGAQTGLTAIQKFLDSQGHQLTGVEYFQLGRLYDLMHRRDLSLGLYRQAMVKFSEQESPPAAYVAVSLAQTAGADLEKRDYVAAAEKIARARDLLPDVYVDPYREGMILMGAHRFEEAVNALYQILGPAERVQESQLRAKLAKKAQKHRRLPEKGPTGMMLEKYTDLEIETAILELVPELHQFRTTFPIGWKRNQASPALKLEETERKSLLKSKRQTEGRFISLNLEYALRDKQLWEFSSSNGYIDLIRK